MHVSGGVGNYQHLVGCPVYLNSVWCLIEKVVNEYHAGYDAFVDVYTFRGADGTQARLTSRELAEGANCYLVQGNPAVGWSVTLIR